MNNIKHTSALIINHNGIGNGIMVLSILRALELALPNFHYYHTTNEALKSLYLRRISGVTNLKGFVPVIWRRFSPDHWRATIDFMRVNDLSLLINLRLQDPDLDHDYYRFKEFAGLRGIECWDLYMCGSAAFSQPIAETILDTFYSNGVDLGNINWYWLKKLRPRNVQKKKCPEVAIFTGSSRIVKRWPEINWIELIRQLLRGTNYYVSLYAGKTDLEKAYAWNIFKKVHSEWPLRTHWFYGLSIEKLLSTVAKSDLIVTHDTFTSHAAAALCIPTIVLFLATNGYIWHPIFHSEFKSLQSRKALKCRLMKVDGTCRNYYSSCNGFCSKGIKPKQVYDSINRLLHRSESALVPIADQSLDYFGTRKAKIFREVGANGNLGRAFFGFGQLHKAKKRNEKAREYFSEAVNLFLEYDDHVNLKKAEEALASLE